MSQTYQNLEIIVVNDGSTDTSGEKCIKWKKKDSRIKVIHQENCGLSAARNSALDICQGDWIAFVDSDDFVDKRYVEALLGLAKKYQANIVQCESTRLHEEIVFSDVESGVMKSSEFLLSKWVHVTAWGKIYAKNVFALERYPVGRIHEDLAVTYKLVYNAENVAYTSQILYFQNVRPESITSESSFCLSRLDALLFRKEQIDFYKTKSEKTLLEKAVRDYAYELLEYYDKTYKILKRPDIAKRIHREYKGLWRQIKTDKMISLKAKILLRTCCIFPSFWNKVMQNK